MNDNKCSSMAISQVGLLYFWVFQIQIQLFYVCYKVSVLSLLVKANNNVDVYINFSSFR